MIYSTVRLWRLGGGGSKLTAFLVFHFAVAALIYFSLLKKFLDWGLMGKALVWELVLATGIIKGLWKRRNLKARLREEQKKAACKKCGYYESSNFWFCPNCGNQLKAVGAEYKAEMERAGVGWIQNIPSSACRRCASRKGKTANYCASCGIENP